jgi:hypothetical protein
MEEIYWSGYKWLTHERWGYIHPAKPFMWYDESAVQIDMQTDILHLRTHENPRYFPELDVTSRIGIGLVSCIEPFGYGTYEIECKLPVGKSMWPAFWMYSFDSWPPEIDVFEAYTEKSDSYFKLQLKNLFGFWNVQTNAHYRIDNGNKMIWTKTHWFGFKDPAKNFIKYKLVWEPDSLKYYYNNRLVRTVTNTDLMNQLKDTKMNVILNSGFETVLPTEQVPITDFIVKSFTYTKL